MEELLLLLTEIEIALAERDDPLAHVEHHDLALRIEAALVNYAPFNSMQGKWLVGAAGGGRDAAGVAAHWIIEQLEQGQPAGDVVNLACRQIEANTVTYLAVTRLVGVSAEAKEEIVPGTWIVPNRALPLSQWNDRVFSDPHMMNLRSTDAALVSEIIVENILRDRDLGAANIVAPNPTEVQGKARQDILRAIALENDGPIGRLGLYYIPTAPNILAPDQGLMMFGGERSFMRHQTPFNGPEVRRLLELLSRFRQPDSMNLAIDRVITARAVRAGTDAAIDLGIALEVVLTYSPGANQERNQEVTFKIATRAGWVMGADHTERLAAMKVAQEIYSRRSGAAHAGRLSDFTQAEAHKKFVRQLLVKVLEQGCFPYWNQLVFGGPWQELGADGQPLPNPRGNTNRQ